MEKQALEYLAGTIGASLATPHILSTSQQTAIPLPDNVSITDLERFMPNRRRYQGTLHTTLIDQFAEYANQMAGKHDEVEATTAHCFVDPDSMTAQVFFDLGSIDQPGHADHSARLDLPRTPDLNELYRLNGEPKDQKAMAEWLEDWGPQLQVIGENGEALNLSSAVAAVRRITVAAHSEATSEESTFGSRRGAMSEVEAKNKDTLPAFIDFTCIPYHGLESRTFRLRVSLLTGEKPRLSLRIIRLEQHQEEMAEEFHERLENELDGQLIDTFVGRFKPFKQ